VAAQNEGQRPRIGGREISVADVNVQNVSQGLSAALSGHGHSGADEPQHGADHQQGNPQGGHGNGQTHPNQNSAQSQNHPNQQSQGGSESQNADDGEDQGSGDNGGDAQAFAAPDEQPDYPEELLPADGANAAPRDGQQQEVRHRGRGRRRGPGRRVRNEGEEGSAPAPQSTPGDGQ
jgi:hypothetical protein